MFYSSGPEKRLIVFKCSGYTAAIIWCQMTAGEAEARLWWLEERFRIGEGWGGENGCDVLICL